MTPPAPIRNILLISIEDLNDWIAPLGGHPGAVTPNLTRLAQRACVFDAAYAPAPACSPSRTATLFGQAPWRTGLYHNRHSWAMHYPRGGQRSIIGQARRAGWRTSGAGKIYHLGRSGLDPADWDRWHDSPLDRFAPISRCVRGGLLDLDSDFGPIPNDAPPLMDDRPLAAMLPEITERADNQFWAIGLYRPHLPFVVPQRYFDMIETPVALPPGLSGHLFDPDDRSVWDQIPAAGRRFIFPKMGKSLVEMNEYGAFLHAYLAAIAYADARLGEVLDRLEATGQDAHTLIVLWSDHGWQLGEKLAFRKFTLWERALRVPLMIAGPGIAPRRVAEPVSLLDLYPTLAEAGGLTPPHPLDGQSLWPLLSGAASHHRPAISAYERFLHKRAPGQRRSFLASTVRSGAHRLIRYHDGTMELYDHGSDPFERANLLADGVPANLAPLLAELTAALPDLAPPVPPRLLPEDVRDAPVKEPAAIKIT
mgnify:FL=1